MSGEIERRRHEDKALDRLEEKMDKVLLVQNEMHSKQAVIGNQIQNIETETKKTNGRVTTLEAKVDDLESDRDQRQGADKQKGKTFSWLNVLLLTPVLALVIAVISGVIVYWWTAGRS